MHRLPWVWLRSHRARGNDGVQRSWQVPHHRRTNDYLTAPQPCSLARYSRAALCYEEAGRGQAAAEALSKGARAVEDTDSQVQSRAWKRSAGPQPEVANSLRAVCYDGA